jgi:hypothetical protein
MSKKKDEERNGQSTEELHAKLRTEFEKNVDSEGRLPLTDLVQIQMLTLFIVQKFGQATFEQVKEQALQIHALIDENVLAQSLESLRARGLLSYATGKSKGKGESVRMWRIRQVQFAASPEVAHVKDLLPILVSSETAKKVVAILNGSEKSEDGEKKSKRDLGYTNYWDILVTVRTLNPILGSQPDSPYLREIVKKGPKAPEADLRFWRDDDTGDVMIPSDVILGWIRTGLRVGAGLGDSAGSYPAARDVIIPNAELRQVALPIIDAKTNKGAGLNTYELIPKGVVFDILFRIPAKGCLPPDQFVAWLAAYAPCPVRGLSPARGRRFGKCEVIAYKIIGATADASNMLRSVRDRLSPDAQKLADELMEKNKGVNFRSRNNGPSNTSSDLNGDSVEDPADDTD